jgi:hypothetical protein
VSVGGGDVHESSVDEEVQRCLEMVAISRVFDVEGLWEVLGEVGGDSEGAEGLAPDDHNEEGMEIIIIDNMTHLINELFARKERSEGISQSSNLPNTTFANPTLTPISPHPPHNPLPSPPHPNPHAKHPSRPPQHNHIHQILRLRSFKPIPQPQPINIIAQTTESKPTTDIHFHL